MSAPDAIEVRLRALNDGGEKAFMLSAEVVRCALRAIEERRELLARFKVAVEIIGSDADLLGVDEDDQADALEFIRRIESGS